jgi:hypothetical protein
MHSQLSRISTALVATVLVVGCHNSPTAPRLPETSGDLQAVSGNKGKPDNPGGGSFVTGTFNVTAGGDLGGGGASVSSTVGNSTSDLVVNVNNSANLVDLDLGSLDTSDCFALVGPGLTNFRVRQNAPTNSPWDAVVDYTFDDSDGVRYTLSFTGSFSPADPYWVSALYPGGTNTISAAGSSWDIKKLKGKGSKQACATGTFGLGTEIVVVNKD